MRIGEMSPNQDIWHSFKLLVRTIDNGFKWLQTAYLAVISNLDKLVQPSLQANQTAGKPQGLLSKACHFDLRLINLIIQLGFHYQMVNMCCIYCSCFIMQPILAEALLQPLPNPDTCTLERFSVYVSSLVQPYSQDPPSFYCLFGHHSCKPTVQSRCLKWRYTEIGVFRDPNGTTRNSCMCVRLQPQNVEDESRSTIQTWTPKS